MDGETVETLEEKRNNAEGLRKRAMQKGYAKGLRQKSLPKARAEDQR